MTTASESLLTADDFRQLTDDGTPRELVRGRVVRMNLPARRHGQICVKIVRMLSRYLDVHDVGHLVSNDSGVVTERGPDTVRGVDVAFFSYERVPRGPFPEGYLSVVPELVFEVRSPTDGWREVRSKAMEYLDAGVTTVCVVVADRQEVHAYNNKVPDRVFKADEELTLPEVLVEFRARVRSIFE
jgi:Uma2 family endonuclease